MTNERMEKLHHSNTILDNKKHYFAIGQNFYWPTNKSGSCSNSNKSDTIQSNARRNGDNGGNAIKIYWVQVFLSFFWYSMYFHNEQVLKITSSQLSLVAWVFFLSLFAFFVFVRLLSQSHFFSCFAYFHRHLTYFVYCMPTMISIWLDPVVELHTNSIASSL